MQRKSELLDLFQHFIDTVATIVSDPGWRIRHLHSDNGAEYKLSRSFRKFCRTSHIRQSFTAPESPEQNGIAEEWNKKSWNGGRAMRELAKLSTSYWSDALQAFTYIHNRSPVDGKDQTPFEMVTGRKPNVSHFRTFGCIVAAPVHHRTKNDNPREFMRFVGYSHDSSTYLVESLQHRGRRSVNCGDCKFFEDKFSVDCDGRLADDDGSKWVDEVYIDNPRYAWVGASPVGGSTVHGSQIQGGGLAIASESATIPVPPQTSTASSAPSASPVSQTVSSHKTKKPLSQRLADSINKTRQEAATVSTSNRFNELGESEEEQVVVVDQDDEKYSSAISPHNAKEPGEVIAKRIIGYKKHHDGDYYQVVWDNHDPSWERVDRLEAWPQLINDYHTQQAQSAVVDDLSDISVEAEATQPIRTHSTKRVTFALPSSPTSESCVPASPQQLSNPPTDSATSISASSSTSPVSTSTGSATASPSPPAAEVNNVQTASRVEDIEKPAKVNQHVHHSSIFDVPKTMTEALAGPDADQWLAAREREVGAIVEMGVVKRLMPLPAGANRVGSKYVLTRKHDGAFKVRCVAQGYSQRRGVDFEATYSPVLGMVALRVLMTIAAVFGLQMLHFDVNNAFLNGPLHHKIYMTPPAGYEDPEHPDWVWELVMALYGLKQAGREWNWVLDEWLCKVMGFNRSVIDSCLYWRDMPDGSRLYVGVFVDDIAAVGTRESTQWFADGLLKRFKAKNLGDMKLFLGLEIVRDRERGTILVHHSEYTNKMLTRFDMAECKPTPTPLAAEVLEEDTSPITDEEAEVIKDMPWLQALGCLNYLVQCTRPDIATAVSSIAKFCAKPRLSYWMAVKRVMRYLRGTTDRGIVLGCVDGDHSSLVLSAFCDSSYAEQEDSASRMGFITLLCGGPLRWVSKATKHVAQSTAEAEYMAASSCVNELAYEIQLLKSIGFLTPTFDPVALYGDNQAALKMIVKEGQAQGTKHILVRYHNIKEKIKKGWIQVHYVSTVNNVADIFTKGITKANRFMRLTMRAGMSTLNAFKSFVFDWTAAAEPSFGEETVKDKPTRSGLVKTKQGFKLFDIPINDYLTQQQEAIRVPDEYASDDEVDYSQ